MVFGALRFAKEEGRRPPIRPAVAASLMLLFTAGGIRGGTSWIPFAQAVSVTSGGGGSSLIGPSGGFWSSAPSNVGIAIAVTAMAGLALAATVVYSRRGSLKSPWSRRRKKHALLAKQWKSFFLPDGRLCDGGVKFLKKVRSGGVDPTIRAEVWPFLLGVYEVNSSEEERESVRCRNRKEYDNLRRQCKQILRRTERSSNFKENAESSECSGDLSQVFDPSLDDPESLERSPLSERESLEKEVSQTENAEREVSERGGEGYAREVLESEVFVSKHLEGSNSKHSGGLFSKHREGSIFKHSKGSASKQSEGSASTHSEGSTSTHSEGSGLKHSKALVSKHSEVSVSKQSEGSVSKQSEGSVSKQSEGSVSKQSEGSGSKQSEVPVSKQSEIPVSKQAEGSVSKQPGGSVFEQPVGSVSKQSGGSVSKHPEGSEDSTSKHPEGSVTKQLEASVTKQLEGAVSKHHESSGSKHLEGSANAQVVQSKQLAHDGNGGKSEEDAGISEVTGETGSPGDSDSTDSDSSESDEPEIGQPFSSGELEESGIFEPSEENPSTSESESKAKLHTDEDFTTWQRIIRLDAVRANSDWIVYSPTQASITELKARRFAESVGLKDYDHLEPCRVFHAARLLCILEAYALYDPEIGYCQGMSDLLSPIVSVVEDDSEAFWCFVGFMKKARHNFRLDEIGIRRQLSIVSKIIKCKDSHLYSHLEKLKAEDCFFVYRMVVVLFRRELNFDQTLCLWEVIWADQAAIRAGIARSAWGRMRLRAPPNEDLLLYAIAASVLQRRKLIIEKYSSMEDIMRECNSMAGQLDVWKLLDDAHDLVVNLHEKI